MAEASHIVEVHSIFPVSFCYSVVPESLGNPIEIYMFSNPVSKVSTHMSVYGQTANSYEQTQGSKSTPRTENHRCHLSSVRKCCLPVSSPFYSTLLFE